MDMRAVVGSLGACFSGLLLCGCGGATKPAADLAQTIVGDLSGVVVDMAGDAAQTLGDATMASDQAMGAQTLTAMPLISRGVPAYASSGTASDGNDASYDTQWRSTENTSTATPSWIAYDLSGVPAEQRGMVDVVWYSNTGDYSDYDIAAKSGAIAYNEPRDYTIEGNAAAGGTLPTGNWKVIATVTGNTDISRQQLIDLTGYNWVRMHFTAINGTTENTNTAVNLDVQTATKGITDSWLFLGDSITAFAMRNDGADISASSFAALIHTHDAAFYPAAEGAGEGGWSSDTPLTTPSPDGNGFIFDEWLRTFPGRFVCLSYGTNDGNGTDATPTYNNLKSMVDKVIAAGKIPAIPHVPWAEDTDHQTNAMLINTQIDKLYTQYPTLLKGPDLYNILMGHTEWFQDQLHPNSQGRAVYRQSWAAAMESLY